MTTHLCNPLVHALTEIAKFRERLGQCALYRSLGVGIGLGRGLGIGRGRG
jgi:hypothetical protein